MTKLISILGSTGSVGLNALKILDKKKNFKVNLLLANKNYKLICKQIKKYNPKLFVINDYKVFRRVKNKFKNRGNTIKNDLSSIKSLSKSDITLSAISGFAGLGPTIVMISHSKNLLIANKESIICGWDIIRRDSKKNKTNLIPVDSEHFAISKLLENHKMNDIKKIYLTASGGPFLNYKKKQLKKIKPQSALKHPKWKMGKKISIDSSTLMNKILELIEAQKLFQIPRNKIDILIHPNSLVHAIITLNNGLTKFIYHETSMIVPLANAMLDGKLNIEDFYKTKNKNYFENLIFKSVDKKVFPVINIKNKVNEYPSSSIIINATNEILVDQFLKKKIPFLGISKLIMAILKDRNYRKYAIKRPKNINQINEIDIWARKTTEKNIETKL
tara:strand:- start:302 stop:1465 length:1164 start_codon:yes stop_codon:yes gene_type:complete